MTTKRPPTPPLSHSIQTALLGALGEADPLGHVLHPAQTVEEHGSIIYHLTSHFESWYAATKSNTILINVANKQMIVTKDPAVYEAVLNAPTAENFDTPEANHVVFGYFLPHSIFIVENEAWARLRQTGLHIVTKQSLDSIPRLVAQTVENLFNTRASSTTWTFEPNDEFPKLTFDIFHHFFYRWQSNAIGNESVSAQHFSDYSTICNALGSRTALPKPWLWRLPLESNHVVDKARESLLAQVAVLIEERRKALAANPDIDLSTLSIADALILEANNGVLTNEELHDTLISFFVGGFGTTTGTLSTMLSHLAKYPQVQDELREALRAAFPRGKEDLAAATPADIAAVDYLVWTVDEAMRLVPAIPGLPRACIKSCTIHGFDIQKGDSILVDSTSAAHDPDNFDGQTDLLDFRPTRYRNATFKPSSSMPFGYGVRSCFGQRYAKTEIQALCAYIVLGWKISRPADLSLVFDQNVAVSTRKGHGTLIWEKIVN
ncbi:unnamed protein product [Aphanomyces euteiches]|nr:hypothetical protein AeRB84_015807 [Aphanomyces euteiches]